MSIKDITLKKEYRSPADNITNIFFLPILKEANFYKRSVGFFSSSALAEISKGISQLIKNNGYIQIIASPRLSEEDLLAIKEGYDLRQRIKENILSKLQEPKNQDEAVRLNYLSQLIAEEKLDIKIALTKNNNHYSMYHEKLGIIGDSSGNKVAFSGSMNETYTAITQNYETIDVFCSWNIEDEDRVINKEIAFEKIWNNTDAHILTLDFPEIKEEIFKKYTNNRSDNNLVEQIEQLDEQLNTNIPITPDSNKQLTLPKELNLYNYQLQAINTWKHNSYKGIFDMATGTGKTFTAISGIIELHNSVDSLLTIIVCPFQHLVEQWVDDLNYFGIFPIIGHSASVQKDWKKKFKDSVFDYNLGIENIFFVCTNATFSSSFIQTEIAKIKKQALIVIDEAHNFGSYNLSKSLPQSFNYRLALSATIERHNDEIGTSNIFSFFGEKCIEYTLEQAINEGKLTPYEYYPILCFLTNDEIDYYSKLSVDMQRHMVEKNGKLVLNAQGEIIAIQRSRIIAGASDKIPKLTETIKKHIDDKHMLIYCGATRRSFTTEEDSIIDDKRQIEEINDLLGNKLGLKIAQFTSEENMETRKILIDKFSKGKELQALVAIKCLDEGVNIPKIKTAFILASTTNPKEYIQRRGRVLRLSEGKDKAIIYDYITLPYSLTDIISLSKQEIITFSTLVNNELVRVEEFSRLALNKFENNRIIDEIKQAYLIEDQTISFKDEYEQDK